MTHKYPCLIAEGKFDNPCSCIPTTHDELLKKIDWIVNTKNAESKTLSTLGVAVLASLNALRAIVELHKPDGNSNCAYCNKRFACKKCGSRLESYISYPCPTIQAIEKELK